jgi:EAL domain-containing protein (putative c-di-GMP-specific phosphodiesterase class I)
MQSKVILNDLVFQHVYQPIYELSNSTIFAYEAFLRVGFNPEAFFQHVSKSNQLFEVDTLSILHSITGFYKDNKSIENLPLLFINVFPSTILNPQFPRFIQFLLKQMDGKQHQLVLELNEAEEIQDLSLFRKVLSGLRWEGIRFALDDVGKGDSFFPKLIELEPEFIKIDKYLCDHLSLLKSKQKIIQFLVDYGKSSGSNVILEGIEKDLDLEVARSLGVTLGQGFLLSKPLKITEVSNDQNSLMFS